MARLYNSFQLMRAADQKADSDMEFSAKQFFADRRLHRLNFYLVLRKLIPKLQAFSQSIQETSMVRFYSSVYSDNKMLIRKMSCDSAFMEIPTQVAAANRTKPNVSGSPDQLCYSVAQFVS